MTSDSLMAPTPACTIFITTSSLESFSMLCLTASTEPCTSALMIRPSSLTLPALICENRSSSESLLLVSSRSLTLPSRMKVSENALASFSVAGDTNISPAPGTSLSPNISTGVAGPASLILRPLSSIIALILPKHGPAATASPT